jgi:hypothetical protein
MLWSRSTKQFLVIRITQTDQGHLLIEHRGLHTRVQYDEPDNEYWRGQGRWRIVSSDEFPQTVGQMYTGASGAINRITDLILKGE